MVLAGTYQLLSRGLLASITASCPSLAATLGGRRWGLWSTWKAGEAMACYLLSTGDALLGLLVLLAAPWLVYRSGLLRWAALLFLCKGQRRAGNTLVCMNDPYCAQSAFQEAGHGRDTASKGAATGKPPWLE